jgi:hypothetical protein
VDEYSRSAHCRGPQTPKRKEGKGGGDGGRSHSQGPAWRPKRLGILDERREDVLGGGVGKDAIWAVCEPCKVGHRCTPLSC